jgi:hypothetical protein
MQVTVLQLHKRASYTYNNIQDKYSINEERNAFALADGTTQSFKSERWAELLTKKFVDFPTFDPEILIKGFIQCAHSYKSYPFEYSSNPAKASLEKTKLEKGGTSTFMGLQFTSLSSFKVISCGDSNLFIINNNSLKCFPYSQPDSLDRNTSFINTEDLLNKKVDESSFISETFEFDNLSICILATDALSRLLLNNREIINEVLKINDFSLLTEFCFKYWHTNELQEDDITAIIVKPSKNFYFNLICPSTDFSFPKEDEVEFFPTDSKNINETIEHNDMQLNDLNNKIDKVSHDYKNISRKQDFILGLLLLILFLIIMSLLFNLFKNQNEDTSPSNVRTKDLMNENSRENDKKKYDTLYKQQQQRNQVEIKHKLDSQPEINSNLDNKDKSVRDSLTKGKNKINKKDDKMPRTEN